MEHQVRAESKEKLIPKPSDEEMGNVPSYDYQAPLRLLKPAGVRRNAVAGQQGLVTPGEVVDCL